jgi:hypothetical protein
MRLLLACRLQELAEISHKVSFGEAGKATSPLQDRHRLWRLTAYDHDLSSWDYVLNSTSKFDAFSRINGKIDENQVRLRGLADAERTFAIGCVRNLAIWIRVGDDAFGHFPHHWRVIHDHDSLHGARLPLCASSARSLEVFCCYFFKRDA